MEKHLFLLFSLVVFFICSCEPQKVTPLPYEPIDKNIFTMRLDEGAWVSDDIYITNKEGIAVHNVHGVLYLTGRKDDYAEATFYRNTWSVGDTVHVSIGINESVHDIQKNSMEIKRSDEGSCYHTWKFKN